MELELVSLRTQLVAAQAHHQPQHITQSIATSTARPHKRAHLDTPTVDNEYSALIEGFIDEDFEDDGEY
jgi:hypothetical protein